MGLHIAWVAMLVVLGLAGCQEYELNNKETPETPVDTGTPLTTTSTPIIDSDPPTTPEPTADSTPPVDSTPPPPSCADVDLDWSWLGSPPFDVPADPVDAAGLPFHGAGFVSTGWSVLAIPDRSIDPGFDRAYRTEVDLPAVLPQITVSLQSDDGIWLWANGQLVAHYGGDWQQEGCVNENAQCLVTERVPDIDLTPYLVEGPNVIAARVSNAVENSYFELIPSCVD